MRRLARLVYDHRWVVVGAAVGFLVVAVVFGGGVADRLSLGGFTDPGSESSRATEAISEEFEGGQAQFVLVATAPGGDVDDPEVHQAGEEITADVAGEPGVAAAVSYWSAGRPAPLRSVDGDQALILVTLSGEDREEQVEAAGALSERYSGDRQGLVLSATGSAEVARQLAEQAEEDLSRAELLSAPATFVALVLVFGAVAAGLLPLVVGGMAVLGTFLALTLLTGVTDVSIFALNLTTALGLGLGIDYSLFIVSRYREELARGRHRRVAMTRTMQTAGRTVGFSAGTVMISLMALAVFPVLYLRSFAYAGVVVVAVAAVTAIVVLPAVLAVLGHRVEWGRVYESGPPSEDGFWARQARRVMERPWRYIIVVTAFLLVLAAPFLDLQTGLRDDRLVSDAISSRAATDQIRENFESREADALVVYLPGGADDPVALNSYAGTIATLDGVARVDAVTGFFVDNAMVPPNELSQRFDNGSGDTWVSIVPTVEPISEEAERLVTALRGLAAPSEDALVGGPSAELVDSKAAISARLPLALGIILIVTFVLLFAMTGSLLVPLKALLLNALSLSAAFGALVWIFQQGNLAGPLGFEATGFIEVYTPILMFCIAFGLSMDYEVFLISRIKEEYDLSRDNDAAVASGLQHTGRIVTAAALLLAIVFAGLATAEVVIVKMLGVGLALAVLVDAFLIRATLVPAFMKLAGRANWWAPRPLRRLHLRYGIWEIDPIAVLDEEDDDRP
jgi:RND superfamily putative drug exporter